MVLSNQFAGHAAVSLFTREWIEILRCFRCHRTAWSLPLYEGVDWNRFFRRRLSVWRVSLFTREWIEMHQSRWQHPHKLCLPLYEGVDWNQKQMTYAMPFAGLPLYEGVDWNHAASCWFSPFFKVSLFTREWIEIAAHSGQYLTALKSPSLRGSGLK